MMCTCISYNCTIYMYIVVSTQGSRPNHPCSRPLWGECLILSIIKTFQMMQTSLHLFILLFNNLSLLDIPLVILGFQLVHGLLIKLSAQFIFIIVDYAVRVFLSSRGECFIFDYINITCCLGLLAGFSLISILNVFMYMRYDIYKSQIYIYTTLSLGSKLD